MIIIDKQTGREFEILLLHQAKGTHNPDGIIPDHILNEDASAIIHTGEDHSSPIYFRLIRKRHTYGGIVFEEGGLEYDVKGKWVLGHGPTYAEWSDQTIAYRVLHPVALED